MYKIEDNFNNPPDYLLLPFGKVTIPMTHFPFVMSIVRFANSDGNVDSYNDYYYANGKDSRDPGPLGEDNWSSHGT